MACFMKDAFQAHSTDEVVVVDPDREALRVHMRNGALRCGSDWVYRSIPFDEMGSPPLPACKWVLKVDETGQLQLSERGASSALRGS